MSTSSGDGNQWTQPGEPDRPQPTAPPAPSGYGTPSSPSYGKYGQGEALPTPTPPPPPPADAVSWGQLAGQPPQWGQPAQLGRPNWQAGNFRPSGGLGPAVVFSSVLYTVFTWLSATIEPSEQPVRPEDVTLDAALVISLLSIPVLVGVWIVTSVWLTRARGNAVLINPQGQRRTEGWVWFGWVLPIIYLWFPKQILDDTAGATVPAAGDPKPVNTTPYWSLWVTSIALSAFATALGFLEADQSVVDILRYGEAAVLTVALIPWIQLVRQLSAAQDKLAAGGPVGPA